jgi:hypothetical protein
MLMSFSWAAGWHILQGICSTIEREFFICGEGKGFAYARGNEVEEFILRLE